MIRLPSGLLLPEPKLMPNRWNAGGCVCCEEQGSCQYCNGVFAETDTMSVDMTWPDENLKDEGFCQPQFPVPCNLSSNDGTYVGDFAGESPADPPNKVLLPGALAQFFVRCTWGHNSGELGPLSFPCSWSGQDTWVVAITEDIDGETGFYLEAAVLIDAGGSFDSIWSTTTGGGEIFLGIAKPDCDFSGAGTLVLEDQGNCGHGNISMEV